MWFGKRCRVNNLIVGVERVCESQLAPTVAKCSPRCPRYRPLVPLSASSSLVASLAGRCQAGVMI